MQCISLLQFESPKIYVTMKNIYAQHFQQPSSIPFLVQVCYYITEARAGQRCNQIRHFTRRRFSSYREYDGRKKNISPHKIWQVLRKLKDLRGVLFIATI